MQKPKSLSKKSRSDSQCRSAVSDGMDRACEAAEKPAMQIKGSSQGKISKPVRGRFIPLKGEKPEKLDKTGVPPSSHWPWLKKPARPQSKARA